jgi:hypothetical protein
MAGLLYWFLQHTERKTTVIKCRFIFKNHISSSIACMQGHLPNSRALFVKPQVNSRRVFSEAEAPLLIGKISARCKWKFYCWRRQEECAHHLTRSVMVCLWNIGREGRHWAWVTCTGGSQIVGANLAKKQRGSNVVSESAWHTGPARGADANHGPQQAS